MKNNPKLVDSNIIDCIPQTGGCPNGCLEYYYNSGFFRPLDKPLVPTLKEVGDKIVRVNSGHDSNLQKSLVLKTTAKYKKKFYNTSIPDFDFPAPVIFTCNGFDTDNTAYFRLHRNIMAVRFRVNTWNIPLCDNVIGYYTFNHIPIILTFMRYKNIGNIKFPQDYEERKSILNTYFCIKEEKYKEIVHRYDGNPLVFTCGKFSSSFCKDCGNCERLFKEHPNVIRQ